jgi:outer membrane receptor protein involved in Fe transport
MVGSPNLVEGFFEGPTPEGSGYQARNPNLDPETSVNIDLGARWRRGVFFAEGFVFQNDVHDGIAIAATGDTINELPVYQNVNVDKLCFRGLELTAGARALSRFDLSANFSRIRSKNVTDPNSPVGDTYSRLCTPAQRRAERCNPGHQSRGRCAAGLHGA